MGCHHLVHGESPSGWQEPASILLPKERDDNHSES